jgi:hypothetical protein
MLPFMLALTVAVGSWTYIPDGSSWSPDAPTLNAAKGKLRQAVWSTALKQQQDLPDWKTYSFQYQGRELSGRRIVYVNAFCIAPDYADKQLVQVLDGGPCYFVAIYDVATGTYSAVEFNGRG